MKICNILLLVDDAWEGIQEMNFIAAYYDMN